MQTGLGLVLRRGGRQKGGSCERGNSTTSAPARYRRIFLWRGSFGWSASHGASHGQIDWQSEAAYDAREQE
jgi:hypothetical protein